MLESLASQATLEDANSILRIALLERALTNLKKIEDAITHPPKPSVNSVIVTPKSQDAPKSKIETAESNKDKTTNTDKTTTPQLDSKPLSPLAQPAQDMIVDWVVNSQVITEEEIGLISKVDPKSHYLKSKKAKIPLKYLKTTHKSSPHKNHWTINGSEYSDDQHNVQEIQGRRKFFVTIDKKLLDSFNEDKKKPFLDAFNKGKAKTMHSNGIKLIDGEFIELKINGDDRLYSTKAFKNKHGSYLVILDKIGNHAKVNKAIAKGIEIIDLTEHPSSEKAEIDDVELIG